MISFFFTYLFPSLGVALLGALLWAQRQRRQAGEQVVKLRELLAGQGVELEKAKQELDAAREAFRKLQLQSIGLEQELRAANAKGQQILAEAQALVLKVASGEASTQDVVNHIKEAWNA